MGTAVSKTSRVTGLLTRNVWWKLAALMLAVLLWAAIVGEPEIVTTHAVPILYKNLLPDLLIGSDAIDEVRVELRGPVSKLNPGSLGDVAILIDLAGVTSPGQRTFTLSGTDLRVPQGIAFMRAVPSQLRIAFARKISRDVPVQVQIAAPPPAGYHIDAQDSSPAVVRISGPENRVNAIASAETDAIDLSRSTAAAQFKVNVFVPDARVWLESDPAVTVRINIEKDKSTK